MFRQEPSLGFGKPARLPQFSAGNVTGAQLFGLLPGPYLDSRHCGLTRLHEPVHRSFQVVLKSGSPEFTVAVNVQANAFLVLQDGEDGIVLNQAQGVLAQTPLVKIRSGFLQLRRPQQAPKIVRPVILRRDRPSYWLANLDKLFLNQFRAKTRV